MQTVFSYLSFFIFLSQNFFPEQMVAWCQETNGSIPQSQLLQVRKRRKWISDTAKSVFAHIKNLYVTLLQLNDYFSGFKQLLKCILMSCDSKEVALLTHERHSGLKNSFSRWSSSFSPPPCTEFLEFQQLSRDPGLPLYERNRPQVLEKALHVLAPFWIVLLY